MNIKSGSIMKIDEVREVQLELLNYIDSVCREKSIEYTLCGGTLIGAIRHTGYIPWDDDIDIIFTRPSYDRFVDVMKNEKKYLLLSLETQEDYYYPQAKLVHPNTILIEHNLPPICNLGVNIDIFIVDGFPSDKEEMISFRKLIRNSYRLLYNSLTFKLYSADKSLRTKVKHVIKIPFIAYCKLRGISHWKRKLQVILTKYDINSSDYVGCCLTQYGDKEIMPKYVYEEMIEHKFEGRNYFIIKHYDQYLTQLYGDYMKLPPTEKQMSHHNFSAYWRSK